MRLSLSILNGSLLSFEIDTDSDADASVKPPFGFHGGPRCESVDVSEDRDPLVERPG